MARVPSKFSLDRDIFGNLLSSREVSGVRRYFAHDGLGGLTGSTDETGVLLASLFYDAWGNVRATSGTWTAGNYRYTGAELDPATGLYHMGARFYDPSIGRWLSEDPLQDNTFDPASLNFYAYVNSNPAILVDQDGKMAAVGVLAIGLVIPGLGEAILVAAGVAAVGYLAYTAGLTIMEMSETKHAKKVAAGQLEEALRHALKVNTSGPNDPNRGKWGRELRAKLEKIRQQVEKLGKSYEQILRELYAKSPEKLAEDLAKLAKLIEELKKMGIDPADWLGP